MANRRFNQQVAQPRMGKMGGGMMNKRSMMKDGSKFRKPILRFTPKQSIELMKEKDRRDRLKKLIQQKKREAAGDKKSSTGKGGGADTGTIGELKSKLGVAMDKLKKLGAMGKQPKKDSIDKFIDRLKDRKKTDKEMIPLKKGGKALKPVDKEKNPGLAKLPTKVRNKMGYMKKGGRVKKFGGGKK